MRHAQESLSVEDKLEQLKLLHAIEPPKRLRLFRPKLPGQQAIIPLIWLSLIGLALGVFLFVL